MSSRLQASAGSSAVSVLSTASQRVSAATGVPQQLVYSFYEGLHNGVVDLTDFKGLDLSAVQLVHLMTRLHQDYKAVAEEGNNLASKLRDCHIDTADAPDSRSRVDQKAWEHRNAVVQERPNVSLAGVKDVPKSDSMTMNVA